MTTIIPAAPGTYIINSDGEQTDAIIAWIHVHGALLHPLFATSRSGPMKNEAYQLPLGDVLHPDSRTLFSDVADWESFATSNNLDSTPAAATSKGPATTAAPAGDPGAHRPINFGTKTFKTKSFWHWPDGNSIFEIEPEMPYPDDPRVVKIKRDEYAEFKRQKQVDVIDPHSGVIEDSAPAADAAPEDDEDDAASVI